MQSGEELKGKMVISVDEGRRLGTVRDLYLDSDLRSVVGVYLGPEKMLSRKTLCIDAESVTIFGIDAVLVTQSDVIKDATPACESAVWLRRDELQGRQIATAGGTKVGTVDDVILDEQMNICGFALGRIFVEGPVAEHRAIGREAVTRIDHEKELLVIDLSAAEGQTLSVE